MAQQRQTMVDRLNNWSNYENSLHSGLVFTINEAALKRSKPGLHMKKRGGAICISGVISIGTLIVLHHLVDPSKGVDGTFNLMMCCTTLMVSLVSGLNLNAIRASNFATKKSVFLGILSFVIALLLTVLTTKVSPTPIVGFWVSCTHVLWGWFLEVGIGTYTSVSLPATMGSLAAYFVSLMPTEEKGGQLAWFYILIPLVLVVFLSLVSHFKETSFYPPDPPIPGGVSTAAQLGLFAVQEAEQAKPSMANAIDSVKSLSHSVDAVRVGTETTNNSIADLEAVFQLLSTRGKEFTAALNNLVQAGTACASAATNAEEDFGKLVKLTALMGNSATDANNANAEAINWVVRVSTALNSAAVAATNEAAAT